MKKLSKLLALLLALTMVFCLVACSTPATNDPDEDDKGSSNVGDTDNDKGDEKEETDAEKLLGEWVYRIDLSDFIGEMLSEELGDDSLAPDTALYMNLSMEYDDEEFAMTVEVDEDSVEDYMDDLIDNMVDYMYDMMEDQGVSKEDLDAQCEQQYGMSLKEYVSETAEQALDTSFDEMSYELSGYYKLDEKKGHIYIGKDEDELDSEEEYFEYSFKGKKLIINTLISGGEECEPEWAEELGVDLPWTFEKD